LLEVLIAFVILGLALGGLLQAFSSGFRSLERAEDYSAAMMHARSKMAEVGPVIAVEESDLLGEFDNGFSWRVAISRDEDSEGTPGRTRRSVAYRVKVTVAMDDRRAVTLTSLRLGEEQ
jgi:general secretion pathway protein I